MSVRGKMKTNLIYFSNCTPEQKLDISNFLPAFCFGSFSSVVSKTELALFADVDDIKNALTNSSIIVLDFSDDNLFHKVQSALSQKYHTNVKNTDFGGFCKNNSSQVCSIINIGKKPQLNINELKTLYNVGDTSCFKMWGISVEDLLKKCSSISSFNFKQYVVCEHFKDVYFVIKDDNDQSFTQELYQAFADNIYFEEYNTPLGSITEIESVRKTAFGVLDFVGGEIANLFLNNNELRPFVTNLANCGLSKNTTFDEIKQLVFVRNLSFAMVVVPSKEGIKVIFIDDDVHPFTVSQNTTEFGQMEYLKNFVCIKIFNKLRKNTFIY